jgi:transcriptional regulator with XRE-family HTH domain
MDIGRRVREVREDLGMQRTVLARRVGVAENTIYRIETAKRTPSMELLEKIARELRTEPAALLKEPAGPLAQAPQPESGQAKGPEPKDRPMPGIAGHHHQVDISEGGQGTEVTYTRRAFLDLYREIRAGKIAEDEAVKRFQRLADEENKHSA